MTTGEEMGGGCDPGGPGGGSGREDLTTEFQSLLTFLRLHPDISCWDTAIPQVSGGVERASCPDADFLLRRLVREGGALG